MTGTVGTRTWSLLASMMPHMLKPCLLVISPDVSIPAAFIPHMTGTVIVFRWLSEINAGIRFSSVFFPIGIQAAQITVCQRAIWKGMALRTSDTNLSLVVQETRPQGLCLVSSILDEGIVTLSWYRMKDSDQLYIDERRNLLALWLGAISDRIIQIMRKE